MRPNGKRLLDPVLASLKIKRFIATGILAIACPILLPSGVNGQTPQYTVTILGGLGGSNGSAADGINASGQIVGNSATPGNAAEDAVLWNGTTPTVLGSLGGTVSIGYDVNNSGQVTGYSASSGNSGGGAVIWNGTTPTLLGSPVGSSDTIPSGINSSGQIVGSRLL